MEVDVERLLTIIGKLTVEVEMLREQNSALLDPRTNGHKDRIPETADEG